MKEYLTKLCMFLFLAALFSGRTNELGVLIGALTGTVLLWPLYRKFARFEAACQNPQATQEDLLRRILAYHRETAFGGDPGPDSS